MMKFIKENWLLVLSLLYILSPIDFIPEFLLGPLGIVEDMSLVLPLLIYSLIKFLRKNQKEQNRVIIDPN